MKLIKILSIVGFMFLLRTQTTTIIVGPFPSQGKCMEIRQSILNSCNPDCPIGPKSWEGDHVTEWIWASKCWTTENASGVQFPFVGPLN